MNKCATDKGSCGCQGRDYETLARVFKALGHPIRVMIVQMLLGGEKCVCELQANSGRDISTISSHLTILKNSHVVISEQRGKNIYYSLTCQCLERLFSCVRESPVFKEK